MKKIFLATIAGAIVSMSSLAHAADGEVPGAYLGFGLGTSQYTRVYDQDDVHNKSTTGAKIFGGYQFTPNIGVEVGYTDLGSVKYGNTYSDVLVSGKTKTDSFYFATVGTLPVNDQFSVYGKLGVTRNRDHFSESTPAHDGYGGFSYSTRNSKNDLLAGIGANYKLTKNIAAGLELTSYGKTPQRSGTANALTANIRYNF